MSDAPSHADLLTQLTRDRRLMSDRLDYVERRLMALELASTIRRGGIGHNSGDSDPVVITDAEPNAPR